jgi:hypothetical protein
LGVVFKEKIKLRQNDLRIKERQVVSPRWSEDLGQKRFEIRGLWLLFWIQKHRLHHEFWTYKVLARISDDGNP